MAEEHGSGGGGGSLGSNGGFILLFFGGIFVLWFISHGGQNSAGIFGNMASSTGMASSSISSDTGGASGGAGGGGNNTPTASPAQVEEKISDAYRQVGELKEDVKEAKIWGTVSPYKDQIYLQQSNVRDTNPNSEYLSLNASGNIAAPINISGWRIQSYVTGISATIPMGARLPKNGTVNTASAILLEPGETALIITGESPTGISFHENACTGYFAQYQTFYPSLQRRCQSPLEEMKAYGNIDMADDSCYAFVGRQASCEVVRTIPSDANLSSECTSFVKHDLTYQGCVANHQYEPHFYQGDWRLYLSRTRELWRSEREIIRLIDNDGKTVSVLEY